MTVAMTLPTFTLVVLAGCAKASGPVLVPVTVKADGQTCVVQGRESPCSSLTDVLTQSLGVAKSVEISVTPEGCGQSAMRRGQSVADNLKKSGFSRIAVVGFLTEPNSNCDE